MGDRKKKEKGVTGTKEAPKRLPERSSGSRNTKLSGRKISLEDEYDVEDDSNQKSTPHVSRADILVKTSMIADVSPPFYSDSTLPSEDDHGSDVFSETPNYLLSPSPGGPLVADWDTWINFSGFGTFFEPQGELADAIDPSANPLLRSEFSQPISLHERYTTPEDSALVLHQLSPTNEHANAAEASFMASSSSLKRKAASDAANMFLSSSNPGSFQSKRPSLGGNGSETSGSITLQIPSTMVMEGITHSESSRSAERDEDTSRTNSSKKTADILPRLSPILPPGKVFPVRIGSELFHLSGASISSDGMLCALLSNV
jgi:hypothetical protein